MILLYFRAEDQWTNLLDIGFSIILQHTFITFGFPLASYDPTHQTGAGKMSVLAPNDFFMGFDPFILSFPYPAAAQRWTFSGAACLFRFGPLVLRRPGDIHLKRLGSLERPIRIPQQFSGDKYRIGLTGG